MSEDRVRQAIDSHFSGVAFSDEQVQRTLAMLEGEGPVKRKMPLALVMALVLVAVLTVAAVAATLWPQFIQDKFVAGKPQIIIGMLPLVDRMKGAELAEEVIVDDVALRLHYVAQDGNSCIVLFSLKNTKAGMTPVAQIRFLPTVRFTAGDVTAHGALTTVSSYVGEDGALYFVGTSNLYDHDLPTAGTAEMTLEVKEHGDTNCRAWEISTQVALNAELPSITVAVDKTVKLENVTIRVTSIDIRTTGVIVRFETDKPIDTHGNVSLTRPGIMMELLTGKRKLPLSFAGYAATQVGDVSQVEYIYDATLSEFPEELKLWITTFSTQPESTFIPILPIK